MFCSPSSAAWKPVSARTVVYTSGTLERPTERFVLQDEIVLDSIAYHLIVGAPDKIARIYVRDNAGFEGTVAYTCEPYGSGQWLLTLDEQVVNRLNGQQTTLALLECPLYMCFCRVAGENAIRV